MDGGRKGKGRFGRCNEVLFEQGPFVFDSQLGPRRSRSLRAEKEKKKNWAQIQPTSSSPPRANPSHVLPRFDICLAMTAR